MIRLVLYSPDNKLQSLPASALKSEYEVVLESNSENLRQVIRKSGADILALDFDSNDSSIEQQLEFYNDLGELQIRSVVMTNDLRWSTVTQFIQRGAHDCIRRPPLLGESKVIVGRACEHGLMKNEIESIRLTTSLTHGRDRLVASVAAPRYATSSAALPISMPFVLITGESGTGKELVASAEGHTGSSGGEGLYTTT